MLFKLFLGLLECNSSFSRLVFLQYFEESTMCILSDTLWGRYILLSVTKADAFLILSRTLSTLNRW